ncbi:MAG: AraC family transcriptional regulator [Cyclobacteriaceae bacterium]|nr:AraC family transcriptional regulator [Cyclobacteriaceae bacterium]
MYGQAFLPIPALQRYVKSYQLWHFIFSDPGKLPFKPYAARPEQALVFCVRGFEIIEYTTSQTFIERPRSYIMGQFIERVNRHIGSPDFIIIVVNFHPGVLFRFTGIPNHELTNTFIDAEAAFSKEIRRVNERLNRTGDYPEMIGIIENFLLEIVGSLKNDSHPIDTVSSLIIEHPENFSLIELANECFLSSRQFERRFKERMGISPKLYARIARANKAFRMKYHYPNEDWLDIALACGYHDYQHMVKDFLDFAGATPASYVLEDIKKAPERIFGIKDTSL